jgi:hypothetical protein
MLRLMNYLLIIALSACATTPRPSVEKPSTSNAAEIDSVNPLGQVYFKEVDMGLSEGEIIGLYGGGTSKKGSGHLCNWDGQGEIRWGTGAFSLGNMENDFRDYFREAVTSRGLTVVRDPVAAVQTEDQVKPTLFAVSATIVEIDANICRLYHWRDGSPLHQSNGELSMAVQWTIYLYPTGQRIKSIQTRGQAESIEERQSGAKLLLLEAFSDAAKRFAYSSEVRDSLTRGLKDYDLESTPFTY